MSIRCALGIHNWKDILRMHANPVRREYMIPVIPSLFAGPPFLQPTGVFYDEKYKIVGRFCTRCNKRRPT